MKTDPRLQGLCRPNEREECANTLSLKTALPSRINSLLAL